MTPTRILAFLALAFTASPSSAQDGWLLFRGDAQRTGAAEKKPAWDKRVAWQRPLLFDKLDGFDDPDPDEPADALFKKLRKGADSTILPGSFPIIVKDSCIYRSHRDIRAVTLQGLKVVDEETKIEEMFRPSELVWKGIPDRSSLAVLLERNETKGDITKVAYMLWVKKQDCWLWANPMIGSLSSDGTMIFAIEDCVFPPLSELMPVGKPFVRAEPKPTPLIRQNNLCAYDLITGKLLWDRVNFADHEKLVDNTHFLGAPLPVKGTLYILNEKDTELRLLTMEVDRKKFPESVRVSSALPLLRVPAPEQVLESPLRRTQPLHIAQADDLLVCPTNAGVIVGVDRAKMLVRWRYQYRDKKIAPPNLPYWQAASPVIHKDRIVFTAADAPEVHCLDLDGKKQWVADADEDLYLASVHEGLVLLVGRKYCRALSLTDGKEKWNLKVGLPAGVGFRDGSLYYVPLQNEVGKKGPAILAIDIVKGTKARRIEVPHPDALGNLALHRGMIVSQSVTHIAAFPLPAK